MKRLVVSMFSFVLFVGLNATNADAEVRIAVQGPDSDLAAKFLKGNPVKASKRLLKKFRHGKGFSARVTAQEFRDLKVMFHGGKNIVEVDHIVSINKKPSNPGGGKDSGEDPAPAPQEVGYGNALIDSLKAHDVTKGAGKTVCIVDTGIESTHADLAGAVIASASENFVVKKGRVDPTDFQDDNGHGTHVAGIVAARDNTIGVLGVAPEASLMAMKVLNKRGSGYTSDVAQGIRACADNGADVINMSLGSSSSSAIMQDAVDHADGS